MKVIIKFKGSPVAGVLFTSLLRQNEFFSRDCFKPRVVPFLTKPFAQRQRPLDFFTAIRGGYRCLELQQGFSDEVQVAAPASPISSSPSPSSSCCPHPACGLSCCVKAVRGLLGLLGLLLRQLWEAGGKAVVSA
jgi:hypothetical protein